MRPGSRDLFRSGVIGPDTGSGRGKGEAVTACFSARPRHFPKKCELGVPGSQGVAGASHLSHFPWQPPVLCSLPECLGRIPPGRASPASLFASLNPFPSPGIVAQSPDTRARSSPRNSWTGAVCSLGFLSFQPDLFQFLSFGNCSSWKRPPRLSSATQLCHGHH